MSCDAEDRCVLDVDDLEPTAQPEHKKCLDAVLKVLL